MRWLPTPLAYAILVGLIAFILLGPFLFSLDRSYVTKANFDRIKEGMTLEEVEEIFGGQGDELPSRRAWIYSFQWNGNGLAIATITFRHGKVHAKHWTSDAAQIVEWLGIN